MKIKSTEGEQRANIFHEKGKQRRKPRGERTAWETAVLQIEVMPKASSQDEQPSSVSPRGPEHRQVSGQAHEGQSTLKHAIVSCYESTKKFIF